MMTRTKIVAIAVTGIVLCRGAMSPVRGAREGPDDRRAARRTPVVEVFETTRESIVNISSTARFIRSVRSPLGFGLFDELFSFPTESTSLGSGFIIHSGGYIVTNAHVVARATEHTVTLHNGDEYEAELVASDVERDLAVIKINPKPGQTLHPISWGRSDDLMIGETAIAIGNPVGLGHTVTTGVISALNRDVRFSDQVVYPDLIQTDASINPGNSGGPLLNIRGELIGINTAIRGDAQNIGFAIPVDQLREVLPEMLDIEKRYRVELGMRVGGAGTARITGLREGSPAQKSGLKVGDVLVKVDDTPIHEAVDFHIAMLDRRPGDRIRLAARRGEDTRTVTLGLREIPRPDGAALAYQLYGMKVEPLDGDIARRLGISQNAGLLVTSVDRHSPADRAEVRPGDLLVQLGRLRVRDLDSAGLELEGVKPNEAKYIRVLRFSRHGDLFSLERYIYAR